MARERRKLSVQSTKLMPAITERLNNHPLRVPMRAPTSSRIRCPAEVIWCARA